jgi:hypothetical protein
MHEWLITRGDVEGVPFEWRIQIYVPWNVVICHEDTCHRELQFGNKGKLLCLEDVLGFYSKDTLVTWLRFMTNGISIANEKLDWLRPYRVA